MKGKVNKAKWFLYRWQRMIHPAEDFYRCKQFVQNVVIDRLFLKKAFQLARLKPGSAFINNDLIKIYKVDLKEFFPVFQTPVSIRHSKWRTDPKTKITSPITFKGNINHKHIATSGENRYVYELNRLHVLPAVAVASIDGPEQNIQYLSAIIRSWEKENPYLQSINWKSGIEVAIRSVNLLVTRLLLQNSLLTPSIDQAIDDLLSNNYTYLKQHLSLYSSANNHLLKELLGLIVISSVYEFKDKGKDLVYYFSYYQKELLKQTYRDGGSKEQSIHYHAAVLNASFLVLHFARKNGLEPGRDFLSRLQAMCFFLDEMTLGGKTESLFGDKDDSNIIYDVFDAKFNLYHSLLTTGKRIFNIEYTYYKDCSNDLLNTLFYDNIHYDVRDSHRVNNNAYTFFPETGYFIFDSLPANSKLFFDVGRLGLEPIAAHGHSDLLHFTLWIDNEPFIVDSGTYQYNPYHRKWREFFRGITSHNTISVNHQHHSKSFGVMLWGKSPVIKVKGFGKDQSGYAFCAAEHSAFNNHKGSILHNRKISQQSETVLIEDSLKGVGNFQADFYLHFHPDVIPDLSGDALMLSKQNKQVKIVNTLFTEAVLECGNETLPLGWYSNQYDHLRKTYALHLTLKVSGEAHLLTKIKLTN